MKSAVRESSRFYGPQEIFNVSRNLVIEKKNYQMFIAVCPLITGHLTREDTRPM